MAIPGTTQALIAAFTLLVDVPSPQGAEHTNMRNSGILFNAASGTAFLYIKGHGSSFFRDGPRLALVLFLTFSTLWAQTGFTASIIDTGATTGCQAVIAIASAFDQLARVSLAQFLQWGINSGHKASIATILPQAVILIRLIIGGVFVGFQRPQFNPVCVGGTTALPLSVAILAIDAFLIVFFFARALTVGLLRDVREPQASTGRSRAILLIITGFALWTGVGESLL